MITGLTIILLIVLFLPFTKFVEKNLEVFLFVMGLAAVTVSQVWAGPLIKESLIDPIDITLAVLVAGLLFRWFNSPIQKATVKVSNAMPFKVFVFIFVTVLGLISSVITAIVAAIILVSIVSILKLDRQSEVRMIVLACFSIGLGAVLTPIGEPLSSITVSKLNESFFYLFNLVGIQVIIMVIIFGLLAAFFVKKPEKITETASTTQEKEAISKDKKGEGDDVESYGEIIFRSLKIYLFVMALTFLGAGFEPFIKQYLLDLSPLVLYWINMVSAILDNATLAAAEISPSMNAETINDILMGLMISGGMLIPGNIPNIIAAGKLDITSAEYAKFAVPVGLIAMIGYFLFILF